MNLLDYIEKETHGTSDFPLAYYYVDKTHPRYEMPFHWHRELEISYILSGSYTFYLNDNVVSAHEGDVVYIESGTIHGGKPNNCVYECIVFNPYPLLPNIESGKQYIQNLINHDTHIYSHFPAGTQPVCDATARLMHSSKKHSSKNELEILTDLYYWFITISETESYVRNQSPPHSKRR
ncbi:MAG: cupin domain-containing protein [Lachnospiraceae bacterium]|nr:cupin domain-containing protein [Lachnospiraceae bacterium]